MGALKDWFKRNSRTKLARGLSRFGLASTRYYENSSHNPASNGEHMVLDVLANHRLNVAVDVGANIGNYSLYLHSIAPDCRIYSFEPGEQAFDELKSRTDSIPNITVFNIGLYSRDTVKEMSIYPASSHSTLFSSELQTKTPIGHEDVHLQSGDQLLGASLGINTIDLLKLDTEGSEYEILQGLSEMLKSGRIRAIQFEYGKVNIVTRKLLIDYYELLEPYGYLIGKIYPKHVDFRTYELHHENFIDGNYLAVLRSENALIRSLDKR